MRERLKNKEGFTLAELLIVVAIIAILVAIMIPVFNGSKARAIQAKDAANVRSEYARQVVDEMSGASYAGETIKVDIDTKKLETHSTTKVDTTTNPGYITIHTDGVDMDDADKIKIDGGISVTIDGK